MCIYMCMYYHAPPSVHVCTCMCTCMYYHAQGSNPAQHCVCIQLRCVGAHLYIIIWVYILDVLDMGRQINPLVSYHSHLLAESLSS